MYRPPTPWRRAVLPLALGVLGIAAWLVSSQLGDQRVAVADATPSDKAAVPLLSARRLVDATDQILVDRRLDEQVARLPRPTTDRSCVTISIGGTKAWDNNGDRPLVPGVARMFETAYVALERLGPDHRFETRLVAAAPVDGAINSNLYLVGGGDPVLMSHVYASTQPLALPVRTPIENLADAVVDLGVTSIGGSVVGIGARHDPETQLAGWPTEYVETGVIGALGALVLDDGYEVRPGGAGPAVASGDPAAHAAARFDDILEAREITISGLARSEIPEDDMTGLSPIVTLQSPPLSEIVAQMLAVADAGAAETILRELGVRATSNGSTQAGAGVVRDTIIGLGLEMRIPPRDGSGIDPVATTTCDHLAALVSAVSASGTTGEGATHSAIEALGAYDLPGVYGGVFAELDLAGQVDVVGDTVGATGGFIARRAPTEFEPEVVIVSLLNRTGGPSQADLAYHRDLLERIDDLAKVASAQAPGLDG